MSDPPKTWRSSEQKEGGCRRPCCRAGVQAGLCPPFLPPWLQWEEAAEPLARGSRGGSRAEEELPKWPGRDSSPR